MESAQFMITIEKEEEDNDDDDQRGLFISFKL